MADSWNKKEREKKKIQKKKEKVERKQFRKDNPEQSNADNFSYVDEYGNVTSTPPDPSKKITINVDDILIGAAKREEDVQEDPIRKGTVVHYSGTKGYGFIKDDKTQENIFVHKSDLLEEIREQNKVEFELKRGPKGLGAFNVKLAGKAVTTPNTKTTA